MKLLRSQPKIILMIIVELLLLAVIIASVWLNVVRKDWKEDHVAELSVVQDGSSLDLGWSDIKSGQYRLEVSKDGEKLLEEELTDNQYTLKDIEYKTDYEVTVHGINDAGEYVEGPTEKIHSREPQQVQLAAEKAGGHVGDIIDLSPAAEKKITCTSSDEEIASVDENGRIELIAVGKAAITITAEGDDDTLPQEVVVPATCFPKDLDTPSIALSKQSETEVSFKIGQSEFAEKYELMKMAPDTGEYETYKTVNASDLDAGRDYRITIAKEAGTYALRVSAQVGEERMLSDVSEPVTVETKLDEAKTYSSITVIQTLSDDDIKRIAVSSGGGNASHAQSMCSTGDGYVVALVNRGNSDGRLEKFTRMGERVLSNVSTGNIGHANGCTYDPHTGSIYVMKTYAGSNHHDIRVFDAGTLESKDSISFGTAPSGIGYDAQTDQFYLTASSRIYITDGSMKMKQTVYRKRNYHSQDVCGYNGIIMSCIWTSGSGSYIDMYRATDGAYLGSISAPFGEIESACVDDGHLVMLFNGGSIYRTKERMDFPG